MSENPSGISPAQFPEPFAGLYRRHLQHLQLQGLRPKTIEAYARAMRRIGEHFHYQVSSLSPAQLVDYFTQMKTHHSWSGIKLDLYGLKFFTVHVLGQPWQMPGFIRPPKVSRLPDIVNVAQAQSIFEHTRVLSYRVLFFTLYSLGLRLGEGLALSVADIDADRMPICQTCGWSTASRWAMGRPRFAIWGATCTAVSLQSRSHFSCCPATVRYPSRHPHDRCGSVPAGSPW